MKLCIVGAGYVGLVTGLCFAEHGNNVVSVDKDSRKVDMLQLGKSQFYEPKIDSMLADNLKKKKISFTSDLNVGMENAEICFICVDTPIAPDTGADISDVVSVANGIGMSMEKPLLAVVRSTVPIGTTLKVKEIISKKLISRNLPGHLISVAFNPEFLREGSALHDFMQPNRIVVGGESEDSIDMLRALYKPFIVNKNSFLSMSLASAELAKYACNSMLATRISFMNELARLAEVVGADLATIQEVMGRNDRIGSKYLQAGIG